VKRDAEADKQHYVTIRTDVVGVQYYGGMVGKGEYVMLQRQPSNQYDPNAVQVCLYHAIFRFESI
jgi:SWI/SNF-related matrix-associated actin-dependent regulator of chromatin subfamily A3